jgi:putative membrane protein
MSSEKPELKTFAEDALPDILKQEQTVKSLQNKLKPSAGKLTPAKP